MPVEIRELVIKATVTQDGNPAQATSASPSSNNSVSPAEEIISTCIERILEILKEKNGR
jgi:Family of unknown function (DUF5908)